MSISEIVPVALAVLKNPKVIIAFIVILLYWSFVSFVLYYKKRPPRPKGKGKKIPSSSPALNTPTEGGAAAPAEGAAASAQTTTES